MNALIPKPNTPLIDARTGMLAVPWFRYFASLQNDEMTRLFWASVGCDK